jgi:hypothetical protein
VWRCCCWILAGQQTPARALTPSAHWLKSQQLQLLLLLTQQLLEQHLVLLVLPPLLQLLAALRVQWLLHQLGGRSAGATGRAVQAAVLAAAQAAVVAIAVVIAVVVAPHPHRRHALSAAIAGRQRRHRAAVPPAEVLPAVAATLAGASMGASCRLLLMVSAVHSSLVRT